MENEPNTDLLPPGHVVIGEYVNGEKKFTVNGQPVKQSIGNILLEMFSLGGAATDPSSDKTFGMDKPHAVGATWEIDMKAILSKMDADERAGIDEKESTGKMKFEKIENMEGMKVGTVSSTILFKVIRLKGLPANMELKNSTIEMLIDFFLPLDEKKPGMGQETSTTSTTNVIRTNADGGTTEITSITSIYLKDNRKPMN